MKFFILIVSFYLVSTQISAQKFSPNQKMSANENKGLQKNLYNAFVGIGAFNVNGGFLYERKLTNMLTARAECRLDVFYAYASSAGWLYSIHPSLSPELRVYYNVKKRLERKPLQTQNNGFNSFGLKSLISFSPFYDNYLNTNFVPLGFLFGIGPVWNVQKNITSKLSYQFSLGVLVGYARANQKEGPSGISSSNNYPSIFAIVPIINNSFQYSF